MTITPFLDRATIARFTLDDFQLTQRDEDVLADPQARFELEDALREVVDWGTVADLALGLWRELRGIA